MIDVIAEKREFPQLIGPPGGDRFPGRAHRKIDFAVA